jgi:hypothetical protein
MDGLVSDQQNAVPQMLKHLSAPWMELEIYDAQIPGISSN